MPQEEQLLAGSWMMVRIDIMGCRILRFIDITAALAVGAGAAGASAAGASAAGASAVLIFLLL